MYRFSFFLVLGLITFLGCSAEENVKKGPGEKDTKTLAVPDAPAASGINPNLEM